MMPPTVSAIAANATQPLGPLSASYELVRGGAACAVVIGARPSTPECPRRQEGAANVTLRRQAGGDTTQTRWSARHLSAAAHAIGTAAADKSAEIACAKDHMDVVHR